MAGVFNKDARVYNLKHIEDGKLNTVRLRPGFNVVDDDLWSSMCGCEYVQMLKENNHISFGEAENEKELDADPTEEAITKVVAAPPGSEDSPKATKKKATKKKATKKKATKKK